MFRSLSRTLALLACFLVAGDAQVAPAATARVRAGWPKISPDRGLVTFLVEDAGDSSDATIAAVPGGATLTVDGGKPIPLVDPLYSDQSFDNVVSYPLNPAPRVWIVDEADATLKGAGWTAYDGGAGLFSAVYFGMQIHYSATPTDTATYPFAGLTPGTYRVSINPAANRPELAFP